MTVIFDSLCFLFTLSCDQNGTTSSSSSAAAANESSSIPVGHWRDSLWDLCRYGPMHPTVWNACCCAPIAAGQVITRLKLGFWGLPPASAGNSSSSSSAVFRKLVYLAVSFWIVRVLFLLLIALLDPNTEAEWGEWTEPGWIYHILVFADNILAYVYMGFTILLLCNLRSQVRTKYAIPAAGYCGPRGTEDFCCSLCCPCLVAAQMMRHTTDYDQTPARCCTETGLLPNAAPSIV